MKCVTLLLALGLASACASGPREIPPGTALEFDEPSKREAQTGPAQDEAALSKAFDAPSSDGPDFDKPAPAPVPTPKALTAEPVSDPLEADRARWNAELTKLKQAYAERRWDEVMLADQEVVNLSERLGPANQRTLAEWVFKAALAKPDVTAAMAAANKWAQACGPQGTDSCRRGCASAFDKIGKLKVQGAWQGKQRAQAMREDDACVTAAERAGKPAACLERAIGRYKRAGDQLMVARAHLIKGRALAQDPKPGPAALAMLENVQKDCEAPRCAAVRRSAYRLTAMVAARNEDWEGAAKATMAEARLETQGLPAPKRFYLRSEAVDKMCEKLDNHSGAGACRKFEKQQFGELTYRDFSVLKAKTGLSASWVTTVGNHYRFGVDDCLAKEAERLKPPASETYAVRWMVLNDGRVAEVHMGRQEQENSTLASCLRQQFGWWRYPRYEGEFQHVEQTFTVTARERR